MRHAQNVAIAKTAIATMITIFIFGVYYSIVYLMSSIFFSTPLNGIQQMFGTTLMDSVWGEGGHLAIIFLIGVSAICSYFNCNNK